MKAHLLLGAWALAALAGVAAPAGEGTLPPWHLSHPRATALAGVEWRRIAATEFGRAIQERIREAGPAILADLAAGADRLIISAAPRGEAGADDTAKVLIAVEGRFEPGRLAELVAERLPRRTPWQNYLLLEEPDTTETAVCFALLGPSRILIGDGASVRAALDSVADPAGFTNAERLWRRARELTGSGGFWLVADIPPARLVPEAGFGAALLEAIETVEATASVGEALDVTLRLWTSSAGQAGRLAGALPGLLQLTALGADPAVCALQPESGWQIKVEGRRVGLAFRVGRTQLKRLLDRMLPGTSRASARPETTAVRRMIRIYGLDEGVRQVPLGR